MRQYLEGPDGEGIDALRARIDAALRLHQPEETRFAVGMDMATGRQRYRVQLTCSHCNTGDPYTAVSLDWPCPTAAVLGVSA